MEKNSVFTMVLVIVLGIFLGFGIVSKQANHNNLNNMLLSQQSIILEKQSNIEKNVLKSTDFAAVLANQKVLENRLLALEQKVKTLESAPRVAGGQPQPAQRNTPPARPQEDLTTVHKIDVAHSIIIGNPKASITIVEFMDLQCPFCARFHKPINEVLKAYPNDVRYIVKHFPLSFHPQAKPAAKAAMAAGEQGKFEEMINLLLENGRNLNEATFQKLAGDLGLDMEKFNKDYKEKDAQWEKYIQADMALGSKIGVRGTPTFFLNGRKTLARDLNAFKREIDAILKKK